MAQVSNVVLYNFGLLDDEDCAAKDDQSKERHSSQSIFCGRHIANAVLHSLLSNKGTFQSRDLHVECVCTVLQAFVDYFSEGLRKEYCDKGIIVQVI